MSILLFSIVVVLNSNISKTHRQQNKKRVNLLFGINGNRNKPKRVVCYIFRYFFFLHYQYNHQHIISS